MPDPAPADAARDCGDATFLWIDLTQEAGQGLAGALGATAGLRCITDPRQMAGAIEACAPPFLCFEFDQPDPPAIEAVVHARCAYPRLPVLMITGRLSPALALWALRIRVWDVLVKPVSHRELTERIAAIHRALHQHPRAQLREIAFPAQGGAPGLLAEPACKERTSPAVTHVAAYFHNKIELDHMANLCRLSPSQFCRVFRHEHGVSFCQYLQRYRIERACDRLVQPGVMAKEVAYSVGFNDLSYFTRTFKRQVGVCPRTFQAAARSC
jgi:two-component system response regulator YesN